MDLKTRAWTRLSVAALIFTLLAGVFAGGVLTRADDTAEKVDNPADLDESTRKAIDEAVKNALAQAEEGKPAPRRTAYVDFLSLLKEDRMLKVRQYEIAAEMQKAMEDIDSKWNVEILAQKKQRELNKPHTKEYRDAMRKQLEAEKQSYQQKLYTEQQYQREMRDYGIERFEALRDLTRETAKGRGYNEVLNIVREVEKLAAGGDDFQALQQQLLVSPVLYFEAEHDITDVVKAAAKAKWDETIKFVAFDKEKNTGGIQLTLDGEKEPLKRNAAGEIEVRLGKKAKLSVQVLDKDNPAAGPRAAVRWSKRGVGVGDIAEDGTYTAPDAMPPVGGETFEVTARSAIDPTIEQTVTIRLLAKEDK